MFITEEFLMISSVDSGSIKMGAQNTLGNLEVMFSLYI